MSDGDVPAISFELVPEELGLRDTLLVGAFMGFPDASMGASGAVRFLVESQQAAPLGTWDGDEFYDFAELRPVSRVVPPRDRTLIWPQGEFWIVRQVRLAAARPTRASLGPAAGAPEASGAEPPGRSLLLFLAHEPRLRWRTYGRHLAAVAKRCGVTQAVFFGAAFADVPHTRPPIITGWATDPRLRTRLEALGVPFSAYQGPSSIQSAAIQSCREAGIACASLFSNGPHYLPLPNANLSLGLLRRLAGAFDLQLDLAPLVEAGEALVRQANSAMEERADFRNHVRQLEEQFDEQAAPLAPGEVRRTAEMRAQAEPSGPLNVDPEEVVRGVENFLRQRNQRPPEGPEGQEEHQPPEAPGNPDEPPPAGSPDEPRP